MLGGSSHSKARLPGYKVHSINKELTRFNVGYVFGKSDTASADKETADSSIQSE